MSGMMNLAAMGCNSSLMGGSNGPSIYGIGAVVDNIFEQGAVEFKLASIVSSSSTIRAFTGGLSTVFSAIQALPFAQHLPNVLGSIELGITPPIFNLLISSSVFFTGKSKGSTRSI